MGSVTPLNFHHLYYFAAIAREGGVAAAARKLHLTHSTLSAQLKLLEERFDTPLFERRGKRLVLTSFGIEAAAYANDIFRLGRELEDVARGRAAPGRETLRVGVVPGMPKTLVQRLLAPALEQSDAGLTSIVQQGAETLLEALVAGRIHVLLTNEMPSATVSGRTHTHRLGQTQIMLYARAGLAKRARRDFPRSLTDLPMVLPPPEAALRRRIDDWMVRHDITPRVYAEVEDAGILRALGSAGRGLFPVRAALARELEDVHDVQAVGLCDGVQESYYAVAIERRIRHRGVAALVEAARSDLLDAVSRPLKPRK